MVWSTFLLLKTCQITMRWDQGKICVTKMFGGSPGKRLVELIANCVGSLSESKRTFFCNCLRRRAHRIP